MTKIVAILAIFTIWGILDFFNIIMIFDKFFIMEKPKDKTYRYLWIIYYIVVTYIYCIFKINGIRIPEIIFYVMFYLRIVPLLWSRYGIKAKIPVIVIFYEEIEAVISTNMCILVVWLFRSGIDYLWLDDVFATVAALFFFILFKTVLYFRKSKRFNIWFANLPVKEYILLILTVYVLGNTESVICFSVDYESYIKIIIVLLMVLVLMLIGRIILINERNYTMGNVIGILEEQMEKFTGYYSELNEKETKLRQFRHDTKNLLLVLHSMIAENKKEQALDYIKKVETMYQKTSKDYDTGNFIADALLSSKAHNAELINTKIDFNGFIPSEKIDDVDMVILLSNILDNALEACEKLEGNKKISIDSVLNKQMWVFTVRNPIDKVVDINNNHIMTSKDNKDIHGFGIMNMELVARSYDGILKLFCEENEFVARVTLMLKEQNK